MKIADKVMAKYLKQLDKDTLKEDRGNKSSLIISSNWQQRGPFNETMGNETGLPIGGSPKGDGRIGRLESIWVDPSNSNTLLVGSNNNGLWKTTSGGDYWYRINSNVPGGVSSIAVNPTDKKKIYIATGAGTNGFDKRRYSLGIWFTQNGGGYWKKMGNSGSLDFTEQLLMDKFNPKRIFAVCSNDIWLSEDEGVRWRKILSAKQDEQFLEIKQKPNDLGYFYVTGINCFYRTVNNGSVWSDLSGGVTAGSNWKFAVDVSEDDVLYGCLYKWQIVNGEESRELAKIMKSDPIYINWNLLPLGLPNIKKNMPLHLKALNNGVVYIGAVTTARYEITDNNVDNKELCKDLHDDNRGFGFPNGDESIIYIVNDGGISKNTSPGSLDYVQINSNLALNECYDVSIYEGDREFLLTGTHDNGTMICNNSMPWSYNSWGDGGTCAVDPNNKERFIYNVNSELYIRKPDGEKVQSRWNIDNYNGPFAFAPSNSSVAYAGQYESGGRGALLGKSVNYGESFTHEFNIPYSGVPNAIAVHPSDENKVYVGLSSYWGDACILRKENNRNDWDEVMYGLPKLGSTPITQIIINPTNSDKAWISLGSFDNCGVYELMPYYSGEAWFNRTYNLPPFPVNTIVYDHERSCLYVGTDVGIYKLYDGTSSWVKDESPFPNVIVSKLRINFETNEIIAATYGAGIYSKQLPTSKSGDISNQINYKIKNVEKIVNVGIHKIHELKVYPNPVKETSIIEIKADNLNDLSVALYELNGKKLKNLQLIDNKALVERDNVKPGTYFIVVSSKGTKAFYKKIIFL